MSSISSLPADHLARCFSFLSSSDLAAAAQVSTSWKQHSDQERLTSGKASKLPFLNENPLIELYSLLQRNGSGIGAKLDQLPRTLRQDLYQELSCVDKEGALKDLARLKTAVENIASKRFDKLGQSQKNKVYKDVWRQAGFPEGDPNYGEHHLKDNFGVFLEALHNGAGLGISAQLIPHASFDDAESHMFELGGKKVPGQGLCVIDRIERSDRRAPIGRDPREQVELRLGDLLRDYHTYRIATDDSHIPLDAQGKEKEYTGFTTAMRIILHTCATFFKRSDKNARLLLIVNQQAKAVSKALSYLPEHMRQRIMIISQDAAFRIRPTTAHLVVNVVSGFSNPALVSNGHIVRDTDRTVVKHTRFLDSTLMEHFYLKGLKEQVHLSDFYFHPLIDHFLRHSTLPEHSPRLKYSLLLGKVITDLLNTYGPNPAKINACIQLLDDMWNCRIEGVRGSTEQMKKEKLARIQTFGDPAFTKLATRVYLDDEGLLARAATESPVTKEINGPINFNVYLFANHPKGGDNWGFHHRYDHVRNLKLAVALAIEDALSTRSPATATVYDIIQKIDRIQGSISAEQRAEINAQIDKLHALLKNTDIDLHVYELATGPKGGDNWGSHHRYDDLNRLKNAALCVLEKTLFKLPQETASSKMIQEQIFFNDVGSLDFHTENFLMSLMDKPVSVLKFPKINLPITYENLFQQLMRGYNGLCIGEIHSNSSPKYMVKKLLDDRIIRMLGIEGYAYELFQDAMDAYTYGDVAIMPPALDKRITDISGAAYLYNEMDVFLSARDQGARLIGIDSKASLIARHKTDGAISVDRRAAMNFQAFRLWRAIDRPHKTAIWAGEGHTTPSLGIPSLGQLCAIPSIFVEDDSTKPYIVVEPGKVPTYEIRKEYTHNHHDKIKYQRDFHIEMQKPRKS